MEENVKFSVLDLEQKYTYDIDEPTYGNEQIVAWGKDNAAPLLYKNCYRNSATLSSVINGMVNYIVGDGIEVNAGNWKKEINRRGMTMLQFVRTLGLSYGIYGGFAIQVIYNKLGQVKELIPLDMSRIRTNESGSKVYYSKKNWTRYQSKAECYDRFDPKTFNPEKPTQILVYKGEHLNVYPVPPYFAAMPDVLTEIECAKYSLNSVSNGFSARYILNMPEANTLTDDQKQGIEDAIKEKFSGSEPKANFMLYWGENGKKIEVSEIKGDETPERYIAVKDNARSNIFIAMRATPNLFGLPATTGFNTQEYSAAEKLYEKTVIDPIRDIIRESIDRVTLCKDAISITPFSISFDNE